ncbi:unnamed protein product [Rhizopus stolonifer]
MKQNIIVPVQCRKDIPLTKCLNKQKEIIVNNETKDKVLSDENLPMYSCTVHKVGICHAKFEMDSIGERPWRRPWRQVFMELRGTLLKIYEIKTHQSLYLPTFPSDYHQTYQYIHLASLSLLQLRAMVAGDYKKRSNVFRIKDSRLRLLIQVQTIAEMFSWIEKISAGKLGSLVLY